MNKKILGMVTVLIAVAMVASPVLAIGPQNAVESNNENFEFTPDSVRLRHPNKGYVNEWIKVDPSHVQMKKATDFSMENVYTPSSAEDVAYNRWNYLSSQVFYDFLLSVGFEPDLATYVAFVVFEGGLYYKEVYTGN